MGHSYMNILIHLVFSTKERRKLIPTNKQEELWRYLTGISKNLGFNVLATGGMQLPESRTDAYRDVMTAVTTTPQPEGRNFF
jgi:hypothetical protein